MAPGLSGAILSGMILIGVGRMDFARMDFGLMGAGLMGAGLMGAGLMGTRIAAAHDGAEFQTLWRYRHASSRGHYNRLYGTAVIESVIKTSPDRDPRQRCLSHARACLDGTLEVVSGIRKAPISMTDRRGTDGPASGPSCS